jgi:hypothetical protein
MRRSGTTLPQTDAIVSISVNFLNCISLQQGVWNCVTTGSKNFLLTRITHRACFLVKRRDERGAKLNKENRCVNRQHRSETWRSLVWSIVSLNNGETKPKLSH